jgi:hypothetical protein
VLLLGVFMAVMGVLWFTAGIVSMRRGYVIVRSEDVEKVHSREKHPRSFRTNAYGCIASGTLFIAAGAWITWRHI